MGDEMSDENRQQAPGPQSGALSVQRVNPFERRMSRFLREPPSIRLAASVIVTATALIVVGGGVAMRIFDHREYGTIWVGMWWSLQTVTTVGYGDVTPRAPIGRIIAAATMLEGIAFLAIITAAITSTFVARAENERALAEGAAEAAFVARLESSLGAVTERLDRLETILQELVRR